MSKCFLKIFLATTLASVVFAASQTTLQERNLVIGFGLDVCSTVRYFPIGATGTYRISISPKDITEYTVSPTSVSAGTVTSVACSTNDAVETETDPSGNYISFLQHSVLGAGPSAYFYICLAPSGCSVNRIHAIFISGLVTQVKSNYTLPTAVMLNRGETLTAVIPTPRTVPYTASTTHLGFQMEAFVGGLSNKRKVTYDGVATPSAAIKPSSNGGIVFYGEMGGSYSLAGNFTTPTSYYAFSNSSTLTTIMSSFGSNSADSRTTTFVPVPTDISTGVIFTVVFSTSNVPTIASAAPEFSFCGFLLLSMVIATAMQLL
eukprot:ANDGO_07765.mRNA.1 hypothetical protein